MKCINLAARGINYLRGDMARLDSRFTPIRQLLNISARVAYGKYLAQANLLDRIKHGAIDVPKLNRLHTKYLMQGLDVEPIRLALGRHLELESLGGMDFTFFMIKPDSIIRGISDKIMERIEGAGLIFRQVKMIRMTRWMAEELYKEHKGKDYFDGLVAYATFGPVICCIVQGKDAITKTRNAIGKMNPLESPPGTIRGDFVGEKVYAEDGTVINMAHGSDKPSSAIREAKIFFPDFKI
jgi:nucleoside-diphosphate kinase